jgi:hypothetical protein
MCKFYLVAIALMTEAESTSETSVTFYQTTRRNNPEDSHLQLLLNKPPSLTILIFAQYCKKNSRSLFGKETF